MKNWRNERGSEPFSRKLEVRSESPIYENRHTTRFSKPIIKNKPEMIPVNGNLGASGITHRVPDNTVPAIFENDLLQFVRNYEKDQDAEISKKNEELEKSTKRLFRTQNVPHEILEHTRSLPIYSVKNELIELVKSNQFVIIVGETGSGKSTQIPQYIADCGIVKDGLMIGITQPRRVAAKSLAERVALELGVKLGTSVGFAVRFESCVSSKTIIKYMTDGLLVKDGTQGEPNLDSYSVIIIDEAHERSIHTDVCFGLLKRIARNRTDLKIIISSATLEVEKFSKFFNDAPVFSISGKSYDVELIYEPKINYMNDVTNTILKIHHEKISGDILVFLTGQDEIETISDELDEYSRRQVAPELELIVVPCYGTLPFEQQQKIFERTPKGFRKIVLATNIAETSVTIDGVVFVIDCGSVKQRHYNHSTKIETLVKVPITKFQAIQRQGRAGRTQPGKCFRLYSEETYNKFEDAPQPDIQRSNVDFVVLDLLAMGVENPLKFEFVDCPPKAAIGEALISLKHLSALDDSLSLTQLGRQMAAYPLDPPLAKVLITSAKLGCSTEILKIISLLSTQHQHLFIRNKRNRDVVLKKQQLFHAPEGDHLTYLCIYNEWMKNNYSEEWCSAHFIHFRFMMEAEDIRAQLRDVMIKNKLLTTKGDDIKTCSPQQLKENICKAFTAGYFFQLGKRRPKYAFEKLSSSGEQKNVFLHPSGSLFRKKPVPEWIIFHEVMETTKAYMIGAIVTKPQWVREYSPEFFSKIQTKYPLHNFDC